MKIIVGNRREKKNSNESILPSSRGQLLIKQINSTKLEHLHNLYEKHPNKKDKLFFYIFRG